MKIEGGCLCGKVRYSADAEPTFVAVCHCKNCQKGTGTAFSGCRGVANGGTDGTGHAANIHRPRGQRQSDLPALLPRMRIGAYRRGGDYAERHDDHGRYA